MSQTMTISALSDQIKNIFSMTKREQDFMKLNVIGCGDFYYYTFLAHLRTNKPLEVFSSDLMPLQTELAELSIEELKTTIEKAIELFLLENGQDPNPHKHVRKMTWRIV